MQSIAELEENLSTYEEHLQQVRELYEAEPNNGEYAEMVKELEEVLEQTRDLLATARQSDFEAPPSTKQSLNNPKPDEDQDGYETKDVPGRLPIGTRVQAVWSEDGEWYNATVEAITPHGYFVAYDEWGNKEEVDVGNVRVMGSREDENVPSMDDALLDAEKEAEATKQALKLKIAQAADIDVMPRDLPAKLRIRPDDPEDLVI